MTLEQMEEALAQVKRELGEHLQRLWIEENVAQCGYCVPGQIMAAAALLKSNPNPNDEEVLAAMSGILCRCGTYGRIRRAVERAIEEGGLV